MFYPLEMVYFLRATRDMRDHKYNRVLYWPTALAVFWFVWLLRMDEVISDLIGFAGWVVSAYISLVLGLFASSERAWRRAVSAFILPLSLIVVIFNYQALMRFGDYLHFRLHNCDYSDPPCF